MRLFGSFADEPHGGGGVALPDLSGFHHGLPSGFLLLDHLPSHRVAAPAKAAHVGFTFAIWVKAFGSFHFLFISGGAGGEWWSNAFINLQASSRGVSISCIFNRYATF